MRIFLHLFAFVRIVARAAGGDRLTKRHKVKKTRIQEVPEFRGPGAASRFGRGLAGRVLAVFRPGHCNSLFGRAKGGKWRNEQIVSGKRAGGGSLKAEGGRQKSEGRRRKAEGGRQKSEGRRRKAEGGRRKAEGRRQKSEV